MGKKECAELLSEKTSDPKRSQSVSLRKSSSDGLLSNLLGRSALVTAAKDKTKLKTTDSELENRSDSHNLSKNLTAEGVNTEKINKAFRTGTGPLILVPQQPAEKDKKPRKSIHNVGIQQLSYKKATEIIKDHKTLKESLFNEVPVSPNGTKHKEKKNSHNIKKDLDTKEVFIRPTSPSVPLHDESSEKAKDNLRKDGNPLDESVKHPIIETEWIKDVKETQSDNTKRKVIDKKREVAKEQEEEKEQKYRQLSFSFITKKSESLKNSESIKDRHLFRLRSNIKKEFTKKEKYEKNLAEEEINKKEDRSVDEKKPANDTKSIFYKKDLSLCSDSYVEKKESFQESESNKRYYHPDFGTTDKNVSSIKTECHEDNKRFSPSTQEGGDKEFSQEQETNKVPCEKLLVSFDAIHKEGPSKETKVRNILYPILDREKCSKQTETNKTRKKHHLIIPQIINEQNVFKVPESSKKQRDRHFFCFSIGEKVNPIKKLEVNKGKINLQIPESCKINERDLTTKSKIEKENQELPAFNLINEDKNDSVGRLKLKKANENLGIFDFTKVGKRYLAKGTGIDTDYKRQYITHKNELTKRVDKNKRRNIFNFSPLTGHTRFDKKLSQEKTDHNKEKKERHVFKSLSNFKSTPKLFLSSESKSRASQPNIKIISPTEIQIRYKDSKGQSELRLPPIIKNVKEQNPDGNTKQLSPKLSREKKTKKQNVNPSFSINDFDFNKPDQASILSSYTVPKYPESLKEIISKKFPEAVLPLPIKSVKSHISKTVLEARKPFIKSGDNWYASSYFPINKNVNSSSITLQQKNIRENQEKKITELHQKHLEEIDKLRCSENASLKEINRPVPSINEISTQSTSTKETFITNTSCSKGITVVTDNYDEDISGRNLLETLNSENTNLSNDRSKGWDTNAISKSSHDISFKNITGKVTEVQQFSFSNYLIRNKKDSVGEKDKTTLPKPLEEKPRAKVDLPKKVHFPDEVKNTIDSQSLVDEKLSRATITNESQSADLIDYDIALKVNTISILKKPANLKEDSENETTPKSFDNDRISISSQITDRIFPNNLKLTSVVSATTTTGTKLSLSKIESENNYQAPLRPPRGEKPARRKRSLSASNDTRHQMSDQTFFKKGIQGALNQDNEISQNIAKKQTISNNQPSQELLHKHQQHHESPGVHKKTYQQKHDEYKHPKYELQQELQKQQLKYHKQLQEQPRKHSHHLEKSKNYETQSNNNSEKKEEIHSGEATSQKSPQPPSRGNKLHGKLQLQRSSSTEENKPDGILVTACKVAEEDQILRLLRGLSKAHRFDNVFLNQVDLSGRTALSYACTNGFASVVEFLTSQSDVDFNLADNEGNTPLHYAAQGGHVEIVSHLVNTYSQQVDLDLRNNLGFTPLMKAALQGRTKIAKLLIFAGASPHLRDYGRGFCALEWAKYTGRDNCGDLIESVQRSCSSLIKERWTSDPELKLSHSESNSSLSHSQYSGLCGQENKDSWLKHKIKKAFHKSESRREFRVASNLSALAQCVSTPLLPVQPVSSEPTVPKVEITDVSAPDCYFDPDFAEDGSNPQYLEEFTSENESDSFTSNASQPTS